jgi:hypothetical protein
MSIPSSASLLALASAQRPGWCRLSTCLGFGPSARPRLSLLALFFILFFILVPLVTLTFLPIIALLSGVMFPLLVALYLGSGRNPWSFFAPSLNQNPVSLFANFPFRSPVIPSAFVSLAGPTIPSTDRIKTAAG